MSAQQNAGAVVGEAEFTTNDPTVARKLAKSIACLAAVGDDIMIEASPQRVRRGRLRGERLRI